MKKPQILSLPGLINVFAAYSLLGWIYELIIKKFGNTEIVHTLNFGPLRPYYGIIGVIITLFFTYFILPQIRKKGILRMAVLLLAFSVFFGIISNFIATMTVEKALNIKLWDPTMSGKDNLMVYYNILSGIKYGLLGAISLILVYPGITGLMLRMGRKAAKLQSIALVFILFGNTIMAWIYKISPILKMIKK